MEKLKIEVNDFSDEKVVLKFYTIDKKVLEVYGTLKSTVSNTVIDLTDTGRILISTIKIDLKNLIIDCDNKFSISLNKINDMNIYNLSCYHFDDEMNLITIFI
jgi:hypothetical protein